MVKVGTVELSDEEVAGFREVFDLVDKDGGGSISSNEVKELMNLLGMTPTLEEVKTMVAEIDTDGNGEVDFEEFLQVMAGQQATSYTKLDLLKSFKLFAQADTEVPNGYIDPLTLENALVNFCEEKISADEAKHLVMQLDTNVEGLINYQEKVDTFMS
mmetsp:Transcript_1734/g.3604  ORF Transcript_1734/g.3604 Transcript_1734/m.3604 type:complete len:158 (-) Transcript_1734:213-686(-)